MLGTSTGTFSGATGDAVMISRGSGTFTFPQIVSNTAGKLAVNISSKTGGTVTFMGDINPTTAGNGIAIANSTSGTNVMTFSGSQQNISSGTAPG